MDFEFLENLKFNITSFFIIPEREILLPLFKGATIRGGLGYTFKKIICLRKKGECITCDLNKNCKYLELFEPKKKEKEEIPRPYVIEFLNESKKNYKSNEKIQFNFILFGKSIPYFPYFFLAFLQLGQIGIGKFREKFNIDEVLQIFPNHKNIFKFGDEFVEKIEEGNLRVEFKEIKRIKIKFITPTRIKKEGKFVLIPEFPVFLKTILRRTSQLLHFWCDYKEKHDFSEILKESENVKIEKCNLKWFDYERYSTRQRTKMRMGGIIGEIEYKGEIKKFYPLIKLGSYIHIGKNTSFGLGKYTIEI